MHRNSNVHVLSCANGHKTYVKPTLMTSAEKNGSTPAEALSSSHHQQDLMKNPAEAWSGILSRASGLLTHWSYSVLIHNQDSPVSEGSSFTNPVFYKGRGVRSLLQQLSTCYPSETDFGWVRSCNSLRTNASAKWCNVRRGVDPYVTYIMFSISCSSLIVLSLYWPVLQQQQLSRLQQSSLPNQLEPADLLQYL